MKPAAMLAKRWETHIPGHGLHPKASNNTICTEPGRESLKTLIRQLYGEAILKKVNSFSKQRKTLKQHLSTLAFLKRCRDQKIVPRFLEIKSTINSTQSRRILHRTGLALLRERINFIKKELNRISSRLLDLHLEISGTTLPNIWDTIDRISYEQAEKTYHLRTQKQTEKFNKLAHTSNQSAPLTHTVKNFTDIPLTQDAITILAKGHNFAVTPKLIPTEEIISQIENTIHNLPSEDANEIRRKTTNALKSAKLPKSNITRGEKKALYELKQNKDIVIIPADKGNTTVVMTRQDYTNKITQLLQDDTYKKIHKDPTKTIERKTTALLKTAKLPDDIYKSTNPQESRAPRLYGLPKIHKPDVPLRPIVSAIGSPTYNLAKYLTKILKPLTGKTTSHIQNSTHFIQKIQNIRLEPNDILVSFDVQSLFTNIPIQDSINILKNRIPNNLIPLVHHCLTSTYFLFQNQYYQQTSGTAMGSPISPVIADLYMEHLEERISKEAPLQPSTWLRYVDDTFIVWTHGHNTLPTFLNFLNSLHPKIQFTMETETNGQLPFLDVLITKKQDGSLGHQVYRKPTHTDRYLHAQSHHHPAQKNSVIVSLVNRAINICEEEHLQSELNHITNTLTKNGFNNKKIKHTIQRMLQSKGTQKPSSSYITENKHNMAFLPYIKGTTDRIARILKQNNIKTIFTPHTKISQILTTPKDPYPRLASSGVYKIPCTCGKVYIGETGRSVTTRLKEHERCTRLGYIQSAVAEHQLTTGHKICFEKTKVIAKCKSYFPRKYRETLEIMKHPNNINRDTGYHINPIWSTLLPFFLIVQLIN
ncbi:hypothetical protein ANTPLA_LOCUS6713 [Anthophora plagiata]